MTEQMLLAHIVAPGLAETPYQSHDLAAKLLAGANRARDEGLHGTAEYLLAMMRSMHASGAESAAAVTAEPLLFLRAQH